MSEIARWSGNDTTDISISKNNFVKIIDFAKSFEKIYLFGDGHIGKSMRKYLEDSGIQITKVVTSDNLMDTQQPVDSKNGGIIIGVGEKVYAEVKQQIEGVFEKGHIYVPDAETREQIGDILDDKSWQEKFWLNVYVTNKCNLGCKSCSAFAPVCREDFYEIDCFMNDITRIKEIGLKLNEIKFTGAEAMLHPQIVEMLTYTRDIFPHMQIQVYTNGLFVKNCEEEKLKKLGKLDIQLVVTEYPLPNLNLKKSYEKLKRCGVPYCVIFAEEQKYFSKRPLRFEGDVPKERYIECPRYKMCKSLFMFRGKMYKCIYALSAPYVNEAFDKKLVVTNRDSIDIYKAGREEIFEYATHRIPFCNYCSPINEKIEWGLSERKIEEWS